MAIDIIVKGGASSDALFEFSLDNSDSKSYIFDKEEVQLLYTAITMLYNTGWMNGDHVNQVSARYTIAEIKERISELKKKQDYSGGDYL